MASFSTLKLTSAGVKLIHQLIAAGGEPLVFTRMGLGDGELMDESTVPEMTALISERIRVNIETLDHDADSPSSFITARISSSDLQEDLQHRELGVYALDQEENELLFSYGNAGEKYDYIPAAGTNTAITKLIKTFISFAPLDTLYKDLPSDLFVTYTAFESRISQILPGMVSDTVQQAFSERGNVALTDKNNVFSESNTFTRPLAVADAVHDSHAVNKKMLRRLGALGVSTPLVPSGFTKSDAVVQDEFTQVMAADSSKAPVMYGNRPQPRSGGEIDTNPTTIILPMPPLRTQKLFQTAVPRFLPVGIGSVTEWSNHGSNVNPRLGESIIRSQYSNRIGLIIPFTNCPDSVPRIQGTSCNFFVIEDIRRPYVSGICIYPENMTALVWWNCGWNSNQGQEIMNTATIFALLETGELVQLFNIPNLGKNYEPNVYTANPFWGGICGHVGNDTRCKVGLSKDLKVYINQNVLNIVSDDIPFKSPFMFIEEDVNEYGYKVAANRKDLESPGATSFTAVWDQPGTISACPTFPSSDWLIPSVEGNKVTVEVSANDTGEERQGVVNILSASNGMTYTIVVNQPAS